HPRAQTARGPNGIDVASWPFSDIRLDLHDVGFRGLSGRAATRRISGPSLGASDTSRLAIRADQSLHSPLGTKSALGLAGAFEAWCRINTNARRCSVPVAVRCIGGPSGTMTGRPPARPTNFPSGVSRHVSPANVCHASGPECSCDGATIPGLNVASMYWAL